MNDTFNCPACGAPLDYKGSDPIIRCPYCNSSVIVPENLRGRPKFSTERSDFTFGKLDMNGLIKQARRINEVKELAKAGKIQQAVFLYREISGSDEAAAQEAVARLAAGQPLVLSGTSTLDASSAVWASDSIVEITRSPTAGKTSASALNWIVAIIVFVAIAGAVIPTLAAFGGVAMIMREFNMPVEVNIPAVSLPMSFASRELSFGGEGSGAGLFDDPRAIAVNPTNGEIYAAGYSDGRVQVFGADGTFITQWIISAEKGNKPYFDDMAVARDGAIYIPVFGALQKYDSRGALLKAIKLDGDYIENLDIGADGTLVAVANGEDILWLTPEGELLRRVDAAVSSISDDSELDAKVAVDGLGKVYMLGAFNNAVFVYSPEGRYLNRFGGDGDESGQFRAPMAIEVDGKGRVFVSDIKGVQVFDGNGRYLNVVKMSGVAFGIAFDDPGRLYATTNNNKIEKYDIKE